MDPIVNHSDPKYRTLFGLFNIGFRLPEAGLVLLVINFIVHSTFIH